MDPFVVVDDVAWGSVALSDELAEEPSFALGRVF